jgi:hypothetical protein
VWLWHGAEGRAVVPNTPALAGQPPDFPFLQMILFRGAVAERPAGRNASGLPPAGLAHVPCDGLVKLGLPASCNASNMSNHRLSRDQQ